MKSKIKKIKKRSGKVVDFNPSKITKAIYGATEGAGKPDFDLAEELSQKVVSHLEKEITKELLNVEEVQDVVEKVLIEDGCATVAKSYILYREKRNEIRNQKRQILEKEEIDEVDKNFDLNALRVLKSRYLEKDEEGNLIESPADMFKRVAVHTTIPSLFYDFKVYRKEGEKELENEKLEMPEEIKIGEHKLNKYHREACQQLYYDFNKKGKMKVSWKEFISLFEEGYFDKYEEEIEGYYDLMTKRKFLPNTPALVNFGRKLGMGLACFVLPIEDSLESIMECLKKTSLIFKSGGGVGYNFSSLRPKGDYISGTGGQSSGPISFMTLFDKMTDVVKQGGIRRGASMGIMNSNHPDIEDFIKAKEQNKRLNNFNLSVFIKEDFWEYYEKGEKYPLKNPRTGKVVKKIDPKSLFDLIVYHGWESAEPGVIFGDNANKYNPFVESKGRIETTNPCGESLLYPNESCDLGSINLWNFVEEKKEREGREIEVNWENLKETIKLATRFLDNVLDVNKYPLEDIKEASLATRKIGLGMMGLGNLLYELDIPYNSKEGFEMIEKVAEYVNYYSKVESIELAKKRGKFPDYEESSYKEGKLPFSGVEEDSKNMDWDSLLEDLKKYGLRNAYTTIVAPTGSISMITGTSSGIEPVFSLVYEKKVSIGSFYYVNPVFEKVMKREGLFGDDLIKNISKDDGKCRNLNYISSSYKKRFVTAREINGKDHVRALASVQKWVDSSVSKTINFSAKTSIEEMKEVYLLGHELGCKDLTVFRDTSIEGVLNAGREDSENDDDKLKNAKDKKAKSDSVYSEAGVHEEKERCPECNTKLSIEEGCKKCPNCGWSACSS